MAVSKNGIMFIAIILCVGVINAYYNYDDTIATATCTGLAGAYHNHRNWAVAIRRKCIGDTKTCTQYCKEAKVDVLIPGYKWKCIDSLHIYKSKLANPPGYGQVGLYTHVYGTCIDKYCGPNYCCCVSEKK